MASPKIVEMIILNIAVALALSPLAAAINETNLVEKVCRNRLVPYDDCVQALHSDDRTATIEEPRSLMFLSLDLAIANASEAMGYASGLAENSPPAVKPALQTCSNWLASSYLHFRGAVSDLVDGNADIANYDVQVAGDGPANCRLAMQAANVSIPAVSSRCSFVELYSKICTAITEILK